LIGDLAKILKGNGIEIGQKRLFEQLRADGYLIKSGSSKNMPTQKSMDLNLMEVKEGSYINGNGDNITTKTTKITGKGQVYFINKFLTAKTEKADKSAVLPNAEIVENGWLKY
jgi:anti-repressor protein